MLNSESLYEHTVSGSALRKQMRLSLANKQTFSDDSVVMRAKKDVESESDFNSVAPLNIRFMLCTIRGQILLSLNF